MPQTPERGTVNNQFSRITSGAFNIEEKFPILFSKNGVRALILTDHLMYRLPCPT